MIERHQKGGFISTAAATLMTKDGYIYLVVIETRKAVGIKMWDFFGSTSPGS